MGGCVARLRQGEPPCGCLSLSPKASLCFRPLTPAHPHFPLEFRLVGGEEVQVGTLGTTLEGWLSPPAAFPQRYQSGLPHCVCTKVPPRGFPNVSPDVGLG